MACPNFRELNEVLDDLGRYLFVSLSVRLSERNLTDGRTNEDDDFRDFIFDYIHIHEISRKYNISKMPEAGFQS